MTLLTIALQKTDDREIAKELVQSTFITFYKIKDTAHQINSLPAYLYTILKNRLLDHYRHALVHQKLQDMSQYRHEHDTANDVETYIDTREMERRLQEEIGKLPPQCQMVFRLRREEELSNKEIARRLSISENTVEQHMRKAIRLLRVAMNISKKALFTLL